MRIRSGDVHLHAQVCGHGPPLVLLHGFLGSGESWADVVPALARSYSCITVDLLGHGGSDCPENWGRYTMDRCVRDVGAVLDFLGLGRVALLGYSMGARVALTFAIHHPSGVSALVCESANPGIEDEDERRLRLARDSKFAHAIERDGMDAFVRFWEALPLFESHRVLPVDVQARQRAIRRCQQPSGTAGSLRGLGVGRQTPVWRKLQELVMPALLVAGWEDAKYREVALRMGALMPAAELAIVPEAGHAVHLEKPQAFVERVLDFLDRQVDRERGDCRADSRVANEA